MMYKCENCGHLFEDGEQARWTEDHGEEWSSCPICKSEYEEVRICKNCGKWHTENELFDGWCADCLIDQITYETFFDYCESERGRNYLDIFVMSYLLGGMDCPDWISYDFHQLMIETYKKRVASATLLKDHFLNDCVRFIMEECQGSIGREYFADWLNKKVVK